MKKFNFDEMVRGWFVGDFSPSAFRTKDFEVGVKKYKAGQKEASHHHKLFKEITFILHGKVTMNGKQYVSGDIIVLDENESSDFHALEDCITVVVRNGSRTDDKYLDGV